MDSVFACRALSGRLDQSNDKRRLRMKHKALLAAAAIYMMGAAVAHAQSYDDRWYFSAGLSAYGNDDDRLTKDVSVLGAIGIGKYLNSNISLEGFFDYTTRDFDRGPDGSKVDPYHGSWRNGVIGLDARFLFGDWSTWRPYLLAGIGASRHDAGAFSHGWSPMGELGVGIQKAMTENVAFRAEAKYRFDGDDESLEDMGAFDQSDNFGDWILGVGVTMAIGAAPAPVEEEPAAPPPPPDCHDLDDDNDGVNNCDDRCPDTAAGTVVGPDGCPQKVVIDLRGVNFKFDRPSVGESDIGPTLQEPTADSIAILDQAIDALNRYSQITVELAGHTDSIGTDAYNQSLSERRAQIVYDYLTSHGIDASRITSTVGYGESQPIATNDTKEGRAQNRRTELKVNNP
jgi:OOP family OmpA-OmpF porin